MIGKGANWVINPLPPPPYMYSSFLPVGCWACTLETRGTLTVPNKIFNWTAAGKAGKRAWVLQRAKRARDERKWPHFHALWLSSHVQSLFLRNSANRFFSRGRKMCVYISCFAELAWHKSLTAREPGSRLVWNNFVKFHMQALRKGISSETLQCSSSETPKRVSKPESLYRVRRCSQAVLGHGKCNIFDAAKKNEKTLNWNSTFVELSNVGFEQVDKLRWLLGSWRSRTLWLSTTNKCSARLEI